MNRPKAAFPALTALRRQGAESFRTGRFAALAAVSLAVVWTGGCTVGPKYFRPDSPSPAAFKELTPEQRKETDGWKTAEPSNTKIRGNWWEVFNEPELTALEEQLNASNQTVAVSLANFLSARALVKQAASQYFPTVSLSPGVNRTRQASLGGSSSGSSTFTTYTLPMDATWELDLWGNVRNAVKANIASAQAAAADLQDARLTAQAELAVDYFSLRSQDSLKKILDDSVRAYQESLKLTRARFDTGIASDEDVAQAETQLTTTQAASTDLEIQRAVYEHAIAVLVGQAAPSFSLPIAPLKTSPVAVPFGIPSTLLERRPDISGAERRTAAANAQIGVAVAAYYPTLTLNGSVGFESTHIENLTSLPNLVWSVGGTLSELLFDGGKRRGVTDAAWAAYNGAVANYRQTVLAAFQDVEDNLATLRILSRELREQAEAVKSSQRFLDLATDRYKLGIDSFLNVITAQTTLLTNQRAEASLLNEQMTSTVQLIKAIGGGWDTSQLPPAKGMSKSAR